MECISAFEVGCRWWDWLYNWQTFVAALSALIGVWLTVRNIRAQINQSEKFRQSEAMREHFASVAALPNTLLNVIAYVENVMRTILSVTIDRQMHDEQGVVNLLKFPNWRGQIHSEIISAIRGLDDSNTRELLADLVSELQKLRFTIESLYHDDARRKFDGLDALLDSIVIQCGLVDVMAESLFPIAQRKQWGECPIAINWAAIRKPIENIGFNRDEHRTLWRIVEKLWDKNGRAWPYNDARTSHFP